MDPSLYPDYLKKTKEEYINYFLAKTKHTQFDKQMYVNHYGRYYDRCQRAIQEYPIIQNLSDQLATFWDEKNNNIPANERLQKIDKVYVRHVNPHPESWLEFTIEQKVDTLKELIKDYKNYLLIILSRDPYYLPLAIQW